MCPPGLLTGHGDALRVPYGRIFFAGTETSYKWSGYMNGAVEAGERAAREVLFSLGQLPANQVYISEPPSIDVPHLPFAEESFCVKHLPSLRFIEKTAQMFIIAILVILLIFVMNF